MTTPPLAKRIPVKLTCHNDTRIDEYYWLRQREDKDVLAYLEAENQWTAEVTAGEERTKETLYREMLSHIEEDDTDVPHRRGSYLYYKRTLAGKAYPLHCRKRGEQAAEQILLDENLLAEGRDYLSLGNFEVSPSENLLAYSIDTEGDELYSIHVRDLDGCAELDDVVKNTYYTLAWTDDSRSFYYVTLDEAKRPYRVWRHRLWTSNDELIWEESDQRFEVELYKSRDGRYIFIHSESKITSEVRFAPANGSRDFRVVWQRRHDVLYEVEAHGDTFYVLTNQDAREFRIVRCSANNCGPEHQQEFLPQRPEITIEGIDAFQDFLAIYERERGMPQLRIHKLPSDEVEYVRFEEPAFTLGEAHNEVWNAQSLRFIYTSLVTPHSVFEYNIRSGEKSLLKQRPVPGYEASRYVSDRVFATARDGVRVPISLVYREDFKPAAESRLLLYGYGAYGIRSDPTFRAERLVLLDRGAVFAIAHIRGGSDLGRHWYDSGKLLSKRNTFFDFIDCAEYLLHNRYTARHRLAIQGGSAGGLLVAAVLNERPELFHAAIAMVPFVDTLTTCLDPTLPLTIGEYEEWGNANESEYYHYIKSYSPYDHVLPTPYPHIFATAGLNDPRVSYWEPAKWIAKMRAMRSDSNLMLLKTNMGAGHFGASGRYGHLRDLAEIYSFLLKAWEKPRSYEN